MTGATNMATRADRGGKQGRTGGNGLGLFALAAGAFVLGAAEFVMMGILPQTAQTLQVSIPPAGHYISAYAIGLCEATQKLEIVRRKPPRT